MNKTVGAVRERERERESKVLKNVTFNYCAKNGNNLDKKFGTNKIIYIDTLRIDCLVKVENRNVYKMLLQNGLSFLCLNEEKRIYKNGIGKRYKPKIKIDCKDKYA